VFPAAKDQLAAAAALTELDGIARRIVLCPPDLAPEHIRTVIATVGANAIIPDTLIRRREVGARIDGAIGRRRVDRGLPDASRAIYGLVNNAALGTSGILPTMPNGQIERAVHLNTLSPVILTKYVVRQ
jgi:hypothetical protein